MDLYLIAVIILIGLAVFDLIVGVSNDAVNFLNSSIGSRVAPRYIIMIIASLGILVGVTFSSGMMEVARKGIFHPKFFLMPELMNIFLAVMLTDVILLDLFNTFGLPTSTTVSIVFEILGAAVAVSLMKIHAAGESYVMLVNYINTGKALAIIMGILLSVLVAFCFGVLAQFATRLLFTFDYMKRLARYSGLWGGLALSVITYFILIKGAKGTSFLSPETILWIKTHGFTILSVSFLFFAVVFQLITFFTKLNILKPIVLIGTFSLAMAFAANDLVNFIGVPLAGLSAYQSAQASMNPLTMTMEALQGPIQTNTLLLLIAGAIMVTTLWVSRKARTVTRTEISLGRQEEGIERFGASILSRIIVGMFYAISDGVKKILPVLLRRVIAKRLDLHFYQAEEKAPSFDLLRASVNLIVASAIISMATSLKLPLSTTYVTFMVAMGTSLSDQAWGRESAVYRITGVITVVGGWFFTAVAAFTIALVSAFFINLFKLPAILGLTFLAFIIVLSTYRFHVRKERESRDIEAFSLKTVKETDAAVQTSFEQTGHFLKEIGDNLGVCFEAAISEDRQRLKDARSEAYRIQKWSNIIVSNIFKTLFLLSREHIDQSQKYSQTIRAVQSIADSHNDIITRVYEHFVNYHSGFTEIQKEELRHIKTYLTRLLWNTSIMLLRRKRVDYAYIDHQCGKLKDLVDDYDKNQIKRIQRSESKTRLSILFYGLLENSEKISEQTQNLLDIFRDSFGKEEQKTPDIKNCFVEAGKFDE
jgi:phosphate/sulfate permease